MLKLLKYCNDIIIVTHANNEIKLMLLLLKKALALKKANFGQPKYWPMVLKSAFCRSVSLAFSFVFFLKKCLHEDGDTKKNICCGSRI